MAYDIIKTYASCIPARLAQLVEHGAYDATVMGSIPIVSILNGGVSTPYAHYIFLNI